MLCFPLVLMSSHILLIQNLLLASSCPILKGRIPDIMFYYLGNQVPWETAWGMASSVKSSVVFMQHHIQHLKVLHLKSDFPSDTNELYSPIFMSYPHSV